MCSKRSKVTGICLTKVSRQPKDRNLLSSFGIFVICVFEQHKDFKLTKDIGISVIFVL